MEANHRGILGSSLQWVFSSSLGELVSVAIDDFPDADRLAFNLNPHVQAMILRLDFTIQLG